MTSWACSIEQHLSCQAVREATIAYRRRNFDRAFPIPTHKSETERCECACHAQVAEKPKRQPNPRPLRPHGTLAAYARHRRNGETPCEECRKAASEQGRLARKGRTYESITKLFCLRGHPMEGDNLFHRSNGSRECRACRKIRATKWNKAHTTSASRGTPTTRKGRMVAT